jgi:large subunit ribosomal protein L5
MKFLNFYNRYIINYDLLNKFSYKYITELPKINSIIVNLSLKKTDLKLLITYLSALKLITNQKGAIILSRKSNIILKVRKGTPIGCKITLRRKKMFEFYLKLFNKSFLTLQKSKPDSKSLSFQIMDVFSFEELETNYQFFSSLKKINVNINTKSSCKTQNVFLLYSFKIIKPHL